MTAYSRIIVAITLIAVVALSLPSTCFAAITSTFAEPTLIFEKPVITDNDVLLNRAIQRITDLQDGEKFGLIASLLNNTTGEKQVLNTYSTTQFFKAEQYPNGLRRESFKKLQQTLLIRSRSDISPLAHTMFPS